MRRSGTRRALCIFLCAFGTLLAIREAQGLTIEIATAGTDYIQVGDIWRYKKGDEPPSDPLSAWTEVGFDDSAWLEGPSGFGYDDDDDATVLNDMEDGYLTLYIRKEFVLDSIAPDEPLELVVDYDDGFIAYLNAQEVARENMPDGIVTHDTEADSPHEAGTPESFLLGRAGDLLHVGTNILAIEVHNTSIGSSDASLIPSLRTTSDMVRDGESWIVGVATVPLRGTVSSPQATSVTIMGQEADFDEVSRTFSGEFTLLPGTNFVTVEALDAALSVVETGIITILYVPPSNQMAGPLTEDATWSGAVIVDETVTVEAGATLTIDPGTTVMFKPGASLLVDGRLLAEGTSAGPIHWTHYGDGNVWGRILLRGADDSRFIHCTLEYSDCEGAHQDYYGEGSRDYHEAIVALACHLDIENCTFQHLPDEGGSAEGDAIAIISDDPDVPGAATANVRGCQFLEIGQGVHTRFAAVVVEDCFFTGKRGDNDDVDLWGESDPPPLIINNVFLDPEHDDMINPTRCSAVIIGNYISGSDDHGIVLRDRGFPVLMNNVITDCSAAGMAIENSCEALLVNNTITNCGRGLRLFDLGRWGPPYNLNPGGGTATVINCIISDCPTPITLADSDNTELADRGSYVTVMHSLIDGGQGAISVSGAQSAVTWGEGNIDEDPLFVDAASGDFHLQPESPVIDAGMVVDEPLTDHDGLPRPCGAGFDMGAYEYCEEISTRFQRGDVNSDDEVDISDPVTLLLYLFLSGGEPLCLDAADTDDSGDVDITDAIFALRFLFQGGELLPGPLGSCGFDPSADDGLGCAVYPPCE